MYPLYLYYLDNISVERIRAIVFIFTHAVVQHLFTYLCTVVCVQYTVSYILPVVPVLVQYIYLYYCIHTDMYVHIMYILCTYV